MHASSQLRFLYDVPNEYFGPVICGQLHVDASDRNIVRFRTRTMTGGRTSGLWYRDKESHYRDHLRFDIEFPKAARIYLSLYNVPDYSYIPLARFHPLRLGSGTARNYDNFDMGLEITKYQHRNRRNRPCYNIENMNARYPVGFAEGSCEFLCDEQVMNTLHNCTTLPLYDDRIYSLGVDPHTSWNAIPLCNLWSTKTQRANDANRAYTREWVKCVRDDSACDKKRLCTEWQINVKDIRSGIRRAKQDRSSATTKISLKIYIPEFMTLVTEESLMSTEVWFGNVGGLTGIWIGASVSSITYCAATVLLRLVAKNWRKIRKPDTSKTKIIAIPMKIKELGSSHQKLGEGSSSNRY